MLDASERRGHKRWYLHIDSQLLNLWGLSLDSNGNVIGPDVDNNLIKIFTPDGKVVLKTGEEGSFSSPIHCVPCGEYS